MMDVRAVAVAGRGLVDPREPVFTADDEALLRGRSVFETPGVYGGAWPRLPSYAWPSSIRSTAGVTPA